jgi:hypothetical protein
VCEMAASRGASEVLGPYAVPKDLGSAEIMFEELCKTPRGAVSLCSTCMFWDDMCNSADGQQLEACTHEREAAEPWPALAEIHVDPSRFMTAASDESTWSYRTVALGLFCPVP